MNAPSDPLASARTDDGCHRRSALDVLTRVGSSVNGLSATEADKGLAAGGPNVLDSPLLPTHLLWINLVTDGLPALCLRATPSTPTS